MTVSDKLKQKIINEIERIKPDAIIMADHIFDNPEVSSAEYNTYRYLTDRLEKNGFDVTIGSGSLKTAFTAEYKFKKPGPSVAFIAEYDALPEIGHACHHHIIASSSINTAIVLKRLGNELCGKIIVVGTPAEELMEAKAIMIKNGVFKGIDAGLMFHGGCKNNTRPTVLAVEYLKFSYKGRASHAAAAPYEGINALDSVIMLFNSINALRQQLREDVRIHGNIVDGGKVINIIPETSSAIFWIRSKTRKYLDEVIEKVKNCARGAAVQTGAKLKIERTGIGGNDLHQNELIIREFEDNFSSLGGKLDRGSFLLGSSDIGNLSYVIPLIHPVIKTADEDYALHTVNFLNYGKTETAHDGMMTGMKALALTAARIMIDSDFMEAIKDEFRSEAAKFRD
jgi:amidohydrolase